MSVAHEQKDFEKSRPRMPLYRSRQPTQNMYVTNSALCESAGDCSIQIFCNRNDAVHSIV